MHNFSGSLIIRNIVGRCHIFDTYGEVINYAISRLEGKIETYRSFAIEEKASFVAAIIEEHKKNREIYGMATTGRF